MDDEEKKRNPFVEGKEFFKELTWRQTKQLVANY
jgi:hypothetical protein